jgi:hypothetical protein
MDDPGMRARLKGRETRHQKSGYAGANETEDREIFPNLST